MEIIYLSWGLHGGDVITRGLHPRDSAVDRRPQLFYAVLWQFASLKIVLEIFARPQLLRQKARE